MTRPNQDTSATDRARYVAKIANGECVDCREPVVPNRRRCALHLTADKVRAGLRTGDIKRGPSERKASAS